MKHGSLFSGIGGFDLAAEWMGWENIFHCEIEEFPRQVLKYYWSNAISYEDIKQTDFTIHNGEIDILTGGFPCQPFSIAGKRRGKEDERHLWPEMLRAIKEIEPRWIVAENVYDLINWSDGLVFEEVQADLEDEGYTVQPYILPAAGVGAPHRRYRVWFVAYSQGRSNQGAERKICQEDGRQNGQVLSAFGSSGSGLCEEGVAANAGSARREERHIPEITDRQGYSSGRDNEIRSSFERFPTQSPVCSGDDELSTKLDGITFSKWRRESIKGYGNAIVPQVVLQIFKAIEEYETKNNHSK